MQTTETWLPLKQAASLLDVHPTTLRRWADSGDIPVLLTPGGHRRFALSDIQAFTERHRHHPETIEQVWAEKALVQSRQSVAQQQNQPWLQRLDDETRQRNRQLGRQLMGLTLQFIAGEEENLSILQEAQLIGREYGLLGKETGLPITESLQAAIFFRDTLIEVALQLPETTRVQPQANAHLMRRINRLINVVQLAIAKEYEQTWPQDEVERK